MGKPEYTEDVQAQLVKQVWLVKEIVFLLGRRACADCCRLITAQAYAS
jgi:hypothetical protein